MIYLQVGFRRRLPEAVRRQVLARLQWRRGGQLDPTGERGARARAPVRGLSGNLDRHHDSLRLPLRIDEHPRGIV